MESDWKIYTERVSEWRERYLLKKNQEIIDILSAEGKTPTERFWEAKERMKAEAKLLADCLDGHSRSKVVWNLLLMYRHGMIIDSDLLGFSQPLRERILEAARALDG